MKEQSGGIQALIDAIASIAQDTTGLASGGVDYLVSSLAGEKPDIVAANQRGRARTGEDWYVPGKAGQEAEKQIVDAIMGVGQAAMKAPGVRGGLELAGKAMENVPEYVTEGLNTAGVIPGMGKLAAGLPLVGKFARYADEYPPLLHPKLVEEEKKGVKTGKMWAGKNNPPESDQFMKERAKVQKDIEKGNYDPYFDVEKRYDANAENYDMGLDTQEYAKPKKPETVEKWRAKVQTPEAKERLLEAYNAGLESGGHDAWYKMGQLEDEFIQEFGPELGPQMFQERFADAMSATTGGADPTGNLLQATFANYNRNKGLDLPKESYNINSPVGGRYVSGNMEMYDQVINEGKGFVDQPKRHNFSKNFRGNPNAATIDEHMTQIMTPGLNAPPGDSYFAYEELIQNVAKELGIPARQLQEVAWGGRKAGQKGGYDSKPMISIVNEAIERTARLTGKSPKEVVRKGLVRGEMPIYQVAGGAGTAGLAAAMMDKGMDQEQKQ